MTQATITKRAAAPEVERLLVSLGILGQLASSSRLHEQLLERAGVRLDRAGASLLSKLRQGECGSLRVTELAERLAVDTPTVTRKVQQLERLGLVVRDEDPADRRAHRIGLTAAGRKALDRLTAAKVAWIEQLLDGWGVADRERLGVLLERLTGRLQEELEAIRGN